MKVLIAGDSFCDDKSTPFPLWSDYIFKKKSMINLAQAGAGNFYIGDSIILNQTKLSKIIVFFSSLFRYDKIVKKLPNNKARFSVMNGNFYHFISHHEDEKFIVKNSNWIKTQSLKKIQETINHGIERVGENNFKFGFSLNPDKDVISLFENHPCYIPETMQNFCEKRNLCLPDGHPNETGHKQFARYIQNFL
jgi:hypothetical protein